MADYTQDILDAEADIREAGELVVVTLAQGVVEDEEQDWKETHASDLTWEDIPLLYIPDGSAEWRAYIRNTDIPVGATLAMMPGNVPFEPTQKHVIDSPSRGKLRIDGFDKLALGSQVIYYTLKLIQ